MTKTFGLVLLVGAFGAMLARSPGLAGAVFAMAIACLSTRTR